MYIQQSARRSTLIFKTDNNNTASVGVTQSDNMDIL